MATTLSIDFKGDPLTVIRDDGRGDLVPLRPLVTGMGLDWSGQLQRVRRHPILGKVVGVTPMGTDPEAVTLPLDFIPGFLFGINADRVAAKWPPKVLAYQEECFRVLARACLGSEPEPPRAPDPEPARPIPPDRALRMVARAQAAFGPEVAREVWLATGLIVTRGMRRPPMQPSLFTYEAERTGGRP